MNTNDSPPHRSLQAILHPPLWARWLLATAGFAGLIAAIAIVVHNVNQPSSEGRASASEQKAEAEANREGQIVVEQDQAPHTAALLPRASVTTAARAAALERAIAADVHTRIDHNQLTGPLQSIHCRAAGASSDRRQPFSCTVRSAGTDYPFLAVADLRGKTLTWCKFDPSPEPGSDEVPVNVRCRA